MSGGSLPTEMRAVALTAFGSADNLAELRLPVPAPASDEVLVRVQTVAANRQDTFTIRGLAQARHPVPLPHVLGIDPAGVVVAAGPAVTDVAVGDRVIAKPSIACGSCEDCRAGADDACAFAQNIGVHRQGGMAEYVAYPAKNAFRIPAGLSFAEATAAAHSFPVALQLMRERAALREGETVLVTAAAGAVGSAAVQLAKVLGCRVIAAAGGERKAAYARTLGADLVIDYAANPEFAPLVRSAAPNGVDLYVESAGNPAIWKESLKTLGRRGRAAACGSHAAPHVELDLNWLFRMRASVLGGSGASLATQRDALDLVAAGKLRPHVDRVLPLAEAREAFAILARRENMGKVVLDVAGER